MTCTTLPARKVGLAQCSLLEPVCQAVNDWIQRQTKSEAAKGFTYVPNRSEISFTGSSMRTLRGNAASLKYRPIIAADKDIHLDENKRTRAGATVFVMATFEKQPVSNIPALYRHFTRHTNSPDTAPWPPEGKDAIRIEPHMRHPNQYVMAISFQLPPRTEIRFFGDSDPTYTVCTESIRELNESYPKLLDELPWELASARVAKEQARLLRDSYMIHSQEFSSQLSIQSCRSLASMTSSQAVSLASRRCRFNSRNRQGFTSSCSIASRKKPPSMFSLAVIPQVEAY